MLKVREVVALVSSALAFVGVQMGPINEDELLAGIDTSQQSVDLEGS